MQNKQRRATAKEVGLKIWAGVAVFFMMLVAPAIAGTIQCHYDLEATIIEVNDECVTAKDNMGHKWDFNGNDYSVGEKVRLKMFTNYTDSNIYDDQVIGVSYMK